MYAGGSPPLGAPERHAREARWSTSPWAACWCSTATAWSRTAGTGLDPGLPDFISAVGRLAARHARDPQALASAVMPEMAGPERDDDMTLLVARHVGAPRPLTVEQPARHEPDTAVLEADD